MLVVCGAEQVAEHHRGTQRVRRHVDLVGVEALHGLVDEGVQVGRSRSAVVDRDDLVFRKAVAGEALGLGAVLLTRPQVTVHEDDRQDVVRLSTRRWRTSGGPTHDSQKAAEHEDAQQQ
jgi:hypothetical protein